MEKSEGLLRGSHGVAEGRMMSERLMGRIEVLQGSRARQAGTMWWIRVRHGRRGGRGGGRVRQAHWVEVLGVGEGMTRAISALTSQRHSSVHCSSALSWPMSACISSLGMLHGRGLRRMCLFMSIQHTAGRYLPGSA